MRTAGDWFALLGRGWRTLVVGAIAILFPAGVQAAGTPAGTALRNTATLTYTFSDGSASPPAVAQAPTIFVARVIEIAVTWQDSAAVPATSPDTDKALSFLVTNTGNGPETYRLARDNALGGDQFDPASASTAIWLESGLQPGLQLTGPNADIPYVPGSNDITLAADASRLVYILSNIPTGLSTGAIGQSTLVASAVTPGAAGAVPGSVVTTNGNVQVVVGVGRGQARGLGSYLVAGASLGLAKAVAAVRDPSGGTRVMTGSVLTYRLVLTIAGTGVASGVSVNDPLPTTLTYVPGSLVVDGTPRTDAADADGASSTGNTVQVTFGNVPAPATRVVEFKATVN